MRSHLHLVAITVLVPLAFVALGLWQGARVGPHLAELEAERAAIVETIAAMEARPAPPPGRIDFGLTFESGGQTYMGELAVSKARETLADIDFALAVAPWRAMLPPVTIAAATAAAIVSLVLLVLSIVLGRLARTSREALVRGFGVLRRLLAPALTAFMLLFALAAICAAGFEALLAIENLTLSRRSVLMLAIPLLVILASLTTAVGAIVNLRRVARAFEPDPLHVIGLDVTRAEAPGLWAMVDDLARRLGAPLPDSILVSLGTGFWVLKGTVVLRPGGEPLTDRILNLPLTHLALLEERQVAAIVAHELAHFAGNDIAYSERFLPIYQGIERSLVDVAQTGQARDGSLSLIAGPALSLGVFAMDRFHHAVRLWSRRSELDADAASVAVTSPEAAGGAMIRTAAVARLVSQTLETAWSDPSSAPDDLMELVVERARSGGLDDPEPGLRSQVAGPLDSHPVDRERLAAMGFAPTREAIEGAIAVSASPKPWTQRYLAPGSDVARRLTAAFLGASRDADAKRVERYEAAVARVGEEQVTIRENTRPIAIMLFVVAAIVLVGGILLAVFDPLRIGPSNIYPAGMFIAVAVFFLALALHSVHRSRRPLMILGPEGFWHVYLSRPVRWDELDSFKIEDHIGSLVTRLSFGEGEPLPKRRRGFGRARIFRKRREITIRSIPPRGLKVAGYTRLMHDYADAAAARLELARERSGPLVDRDPAGPSNVLPEAERMPSSGERA